MEDIVGVLYFLKLTRNGRAPEVLKQLILPLIVQSVNSLLLPVLFLVTITRRAVCFVSRKDMPFGCGHQTCHGCGPILSNCPICRKSIELIVERRRYQVLYNK